MKIDNDKFFGLKYLDIPIDDDFVNDLNLTNLSLCEHKIEIENNITYNYVSEFLKRKPDDIFFITKSCEKIIDDIRIPKFTKHTYLKKMSNQHSFLILNEKSFIIFEKNDDYIYSYYLELDNLGDVIFLPIYVSLQSGDIFSAHGDFINKVKSEEIVLKLIKSLVYIELSDTEFKFIKPNGKIGSRNNNTSFKNNTKFPLHIVDSVWNNIVIRKEGFKVSGHFRLQPCGIKKMDRKLIWITEHKKDGYIRGLRKRI